MYTKNVIAFFGTKTAAARALGISQVAVSRWGEIVPEKRAARLAWVTDGALKYDPAIYAEQANAKRQGNLIHENQQGSGTGADYQRN